MKNQSFDIKGEKPSERENYNNSSEGEREKKKLKNWTAKRTKDLWKHARSSEWNWETGRTHQLKYYKRLSGD